MKTLKNIVTLLVIGSVLIFAGCEEEDSTKTISKDEAVQTLNQNSQDLESDLQAMENTEGMQAIEVLASLTQESDPFASPTKSIGDEFLIGKIQQIMRPVESQNLQKFGSQPFNFGDHTGTYTWQSEGVWTEDPNPTDSIIIEFPTDTTADPLTNNAVFALSNYEETAVTDSLDNTVYVPTKVEASLTIDGTKVVDLSWNLEITETDGETVLSSLDATVYVKPFTYTVSLTQNSLSASINRDNVETSLMSINLNVTFMDNMEDVEKLKGNVQVHNLNFKGWVKPYAMENREFSSTDMTTADILDYYNEQIDLALFKYDTGNKIADVKFVETDTQTSEPPMELVFVFKDDSTEPVKGYFENIYQYLQQLLGQGNM